MLSFESTEVLCCCYDVTCQKGFAPQNLRSCLAISSVTHCHAAEGIKGRRCALQSMGQGAQVVILERNWPALARTSRSSRAVSI